MQSGNQQQGDNPVPMGEFEGVYCFANDPYECELVYDLATITHTGEFKCQICDLTGDRQAAGDDDDFGGYDEHKHNGISCTLECSYDSSTG